MCNKLPSDAIKSPMPNTAKIALEIPVDTSKTTSLTVRGCFFLSSNVDFSFTGVDELTVASIINSS